MGTDCSIYLPGRVRLDAVSKVIGICAGLPCERTETGLDVRGVSLKISDTQILATCPIIILKATEPHLRMVDGETNHHVMYHMEGTLQVGDDDQRGMRHRYEGGRLLSPPSTGFWCAIGLRLVSFFGGVLDYNDCDEIYEDVIVPEQPNIAPHNNPAWDEFWDAITAMQPISADEMAAANRLAAYESKHQTPMLSAEMVTADRMKDPIFAAAVRAEVERRLADGKHGKKGVR